MKNKDSKDMNSKDVITSLRTQSKESQPTAEFEAKLGRAIKDSASKKYEKENFFVKMGRLVDSKFAPIFGFLIIASAVTLTMLNNRVIEPSGFTDNNNTQSHLLKMYNIKFDDGKYESKNSFWDDLDFSGKVTSRPSFDYVMSDSSYEPIMGQFQGPLSGGKIDDNELFVKFLKYLEDTDFNDVIKIDVSERYQISVLGGSLGEKLNITDNLGNKYLLTLDNDGTIYFNPSVYDFTYKNQDYCENSQCQYKVGERTGYTVEFENKVYQIDASEKVWKFEGSSVANPFTEQPTIENVDVAFILDTTGSMSDQIERLQETIRSISTEVSSKNSLFELRFGLVLYRDRGDEYHVKKYDFTSDINEFQKNIDEAYASGGGDYEEDVNYALQTAIEELNWSEAKKTVKLAFLVADAPAHMDYGQQYDYRVAMLRALEEGIKIYPIASSGLDNTKGEYMFRQIAFITNASYIFITGDNGETDFHIGSEDFSVKNIDKIVIEVIEGEIK